MTNTQLLLTIGIPSVLVVLAWLSSNTRLTRLENRLDTMSDIHHRDAIELLRAMTALHERVATVEARQR